MGKLLRIAAIVAVLAILGAGTAITVVDGLIDLHVVAGLNTPAALNTARKIAHDKGVNRLHLMGRFGGEEPITVDLVTKGQILQFAVPPNRAQLGGFFRLLRLELEFSPVITGRSADRTVVITR